MLTSVCPKLPFRIDSETKDYYITQLGFKLDSQYPDYLIFSKDDVELHFFKFEDLDELTNYGQVYVRVKDIDVFYKHLLSIGTQIHPNGALATKPWGQREFSVLDPDYNLITFGESV
jgi:catechol 2,3-dioxygenase-like lactoylglutathione lyase family enzyme